MYSLMTSNDVEAQRQPLLDVPDRAAAEPSKPADHAPDADRTGVVATVLTMVLSIPALGRHTCVLLTFRHVPAARHLVQ